MENTKMITCSLCKEEKEITDFYTQNDRKSGHYSQCKKCHDQKMMVRWKERKLWAIDYKGGKCQECSQVYPPFIYEFHHLDPKSKDFDWKKMRLISHDKMVLELGKCVLLCSNCHRTRHNTIK